MLTAVKQHASAIPYSYGSEKERCSSLEIAEARLGKDHPSVAATLSNLGSVLSDARTQWINTFWDPNIDEAAQAYPWKLYEDRYHRGLWYHRCGKRKTRGPRPVSARGRSKLRSETTMTCGPAKLQNFWRKRSQGCRKPLDQLSQDQRSATNNASESMRT